MQSSGSLQQLSYRELVCQKEEQILTKMEVGWSSGFQRNCFTDFLCNERLKELLSNLITALVEFVVVELFLTTFHSRNRTAE